MKYWLQKNNKDNEISSKLKNEVNFHKNFNKIFCIGANKTGTTTLEVVLKNLSFQLGDQLIAESRITRQVLEGEFYDFQEYCKQYDAFQDLPFSLFDTYIVADVLFPKSKFILTERDPEQWYRSIRDFHKNMFHIEDMNSLTEQDILNKFMPHIPGLSHYLESKNLLNFENALPFVDWDKLYDKDFYISEYIARNNRIKKYFSNRPNDLLTIDITTEPNTKKIIDFLELPEKMSSSMPHANKTIR